MSDVSQRQKWAVCSLCYQSSQVQDAPRLKSESSQWEGKKHNKQTAHICSHCILKRHHLPLSIKDRAVNTAAVWADPDIIIL